MGSIIGAGGLGFRVRDGNGHYPSAMAAGIIDVLIRAPPSGHISGELTHGAGPHRADGRKAKGIREAVIWPSLTTH